MASEHHGHRHEGCCKNNDPLAHLREPYTRPDGSFLITGDEIIGDLVAAFPKAAAVMLRYGLHCVGCSANAFDTVADGARLHGMPEGDIQEMIAELNMTLNKRIETIELTPKAIATVKELRSKETGKESWPLRITVASDGGAGFAYEMDFDQEKEGDVALVFDGLQIIVDKKSMPLLKGSSIDFVESLAASGFKIDNPNVAKGCACGKHTD